MAHITSRLSIRQLVLVPTLLTLAVTVLRLLGELRGSHGPWFDKDSGIVGITWLPPIFGFYFALKLWRRGERPQRVGRAFALGLLGVLLTRPLRPPSFHTLTSAYSASWGSFGRSRP